MPQLAPSLDLLQGVPAYHLFGRIDRVQGFTVDVVGLSGFLGVGDRVCVQGRSKELTPAEVASSDRASTRAVVQGTVDGLGTGCAVFVNSARKSATLNPSENWLGRIVDPEGRPIDGRPRPAPGKMRDVRASAPPAATRDRLGPPVDLGVRVVNAFATCRAGQRLGLFAAAGVGKSTLLAMFAKFAESDVIVIAMVGERGRELREFVEDELGSEGLARSVVVVATSDASPLTRREAAYAAMTVAEHFRDQGKSVLLLVDSLTRFCHALREIALAAGELPSARGYPVSVFAELPKLLERAGPGSAETGCSGQITAIFTVLVDGDDHDEPVADAVRGILDGHLILGRSIAQAGRFPAVDVVRSLSRTVPGCLTDAQARTMWKARRLLSQFEDVADLMRLGLYRSGQDVLVDEAVAIAPGIYQWLVQDRNEHAAFDETFAELGRLVEKPAA